MFCLSFIPLYSLSQNKKLTDHLIRQCDELNSSYFYLFIIFKDQFLYPRDLKIGNVNFFQLRVIYGVYYGQATRNFST